MAGETYARRWATWHDESTAQDTPADAQFYQKAEDALVRLLGEDPATNEVPVWTPGSGRFVFQKLTTAQLDPAAAILGSQLATGLNGPPGSQVAYDEVAADQTSTQVTAAAASQIITSNGGIGLAYDGSAVIIEFFCAEVFHSVASTLVIFELYDGASGIGRFGSAITPAAGGNGNHVYLRRKLTPSVATHTYNIRMWVAAAGTGTAKAGGGGAAGTFVPMFLRITKA